MEYIDQIADFLANRLDEESLQKFKTELERNPDLQDAVENFPIVLEALEAKVQDDARASLERIRQPDTIALVTESNNRKFSPLVFYKYAAAVLLLVTSSFLIWNNVLKEQSLSSDEIYSSYYKSYPDISGPSRSNAAVDSVQMERALAFSNYNQGNYADFRKKILALPDTYPQRLDDQFFIGVSYLENGEFETAIEILSDLMNSELTYKDDAKWYSALALIKNNNCQQALPLLRDLESAQLSYSEEATEILNKMEC